MKNYMKSDIIKGIRSYVNYNNDFYGLKFTEFLLHNAKNYEDIYISSEVISKYLFNQNDNTIRSSVFNILKMINADMSGVCFDGYIIRGLDFKGLENVKIDLNKIPNKDLSYTNFDNVELIGNLDNAIIDCTNFCSYKGEVKLDPQKIHNKEIYNSKLSGLVINGSFDYVNINMVNFDGLIGDVIINPQKISNKNLHGLDFSGVRFVGDYDVTSNSYLAPSFYGCKISNCKFHNLKEVVNIDLNELLFDSPGSRLILCDVTDVILTGNVISHYYPATLMGIDGSLLFYDYKDDLFGSYYKNDKGETIHIHLFKSVKYNYNSKTWEYVNRSLEDNIKINVSYPKINSDNKKVKILSIFNKDFD